MKIHHLLKILRQKYPRVAQGELRSILSHTLKITATQIITQADHKVSEMDIDKIQDLVHRLDQGEPLSRVLGYREFWSLNFKLSSDTLDPRPDTETLVEAVLKLMPDLKRNFTMLDLGTGTGCLLISLLTEYKNAEGIGVDIREGVISTAQENALFHNVEPRVNFLKTHWFDGIEGRFDLIVSNPPYIKEEDYAHLDHNVRAYDPKKALIGGGDGLDCYREIIKKAPAYLNRDGIIVLEIGHDQGLSVFDLLQAHAFKGIQIFKDLEGRDRCLAAQKG